MFISNKSCHVLRYRSNSRSTQTLKYTLCLFPLCLFIDVPLDVHIRGCFTVDQDVEGCVTDKSIINQQRGILSNTLKVISALNLADFDGRLCVNRSSRTQQACWIVISMLVIFLFLFLE